MKKQISFIPFSSKNTPPAGSKQKPNGLDDHVVMVSLAEP